MAVLLTRYPGLAGRHNRGCARLREMEETPEILGRRRGGFFGP